ncbi:MAG TPA: DUF1877 family protein [Anaerolineales bacterium]|nr:DUF1877 family protein [Anaerolineales bacterium]
MSVEEKLIRLSTSDFASLQIQPGALSDLIEDLYGADYFDSRSVYKRPVNFDIPAPHMIHIDEFTIWLLTDRNELTALCDAVAAWRDNQELIGAQHGQGFAYATFQSPEAVSAIARGLEIYPQEELSKRFFSQAESFRQAAAPYFGEDEAILAYQRDFFELLHKFYQEASSGREFVLHLIV